MIKIINKIIENWKSIFLGLIYSYKIQKIIRDNYKNIKIEDSIEIIGIFSKLLEDFFSDKKVIKKLELEGMKDVIPLLMNFLIRTK